MRLTITVWRRILLLFVGITPIAWVVVAAVAADNGAIERSELSLLLGSTGNGGFAQVTEPREFEFPRDHGPHSEYRNEWWYMTGNVHGTDGRRFGFELTFFRFALTSVEQKPDSGWRTNQVYIAHFAITDADRQRFYVAERFSRGALGLAGAQADPFRVWIDDWEIAAARNIDVEAGSSTAERWHLRASDDDVALDLAFVAEKGPVLNGVDGLSQKSAETGNASYYYSMTRWLTEGRVQIGSESFAVSGLAWLDREWGSSSLAPDQKGWDWFALQLSDGSELMFYNLRKIDGTQDTFSAGTWVSADGIVRHIRRDEISIAVTETWSSPGGGSYPSAWDIRLPLYDLTLRVTPVMDDQELFTTVRYWEGAVDITGVRAGEDIDGHGYVELTGYAD